MKPKAEPMIIPGDFVIGQWAICVRNRCNAHKPDGSGNQMEPGDLFQVINLDSVNLEYEIAGGGRNVLDRVDARPWLPQPGEACVFQKTPLVLDYGDNELRDRRSPSLSHHYLKEGEVIEVIGPATPSFCIMIQGIKETIGSKAITYDYRPGARSWVWSCQLAPVVKASVHTTVQKSCSCDVTTLMRSGCTCGAVQKYQDSFGG